MVSNENQRPGRSPGELRADCPVCAGKQPTIEWDGRGFLRTSRSRVTPTLPDDQCCPGVTMSASSRSAGAQANCARASSPSCATHAIRESKSESLRQMGRGVISFQMHRRPDWKRRPFILKIHRVASGWGGRDRTSEWRNQNQFDYSMIPICIWKKAQNCAPTISIAWQLFPNEMAGYDRRCGGRRMTRIFEYVSLIAIMAFNSSRVASLLLEGYASMSVSLAPPGSPFTPPLPSRIGRAQIRPGDRDCFRVGCAPALALPPAA